VLAFADVVYLFANEFSGLCGRSLACALVTPGAPESFLLGHRSILLITDWKLAWGHPVEQSFAQMAAAPVDRQARDFVKRARFFKEVRRAGNDDELHVRSHSEFCLLVQLDDGLVAFSDDEERRRLDVRQSATGKIGAPAA
jgi:hypothetical protein